MTVPARKYNPGVAKHTQDTFARDVGIDVEDEGRGIFDEFHRIEVRRLKDRAAEDARLIRKLWRLEGIWKLAAALGWGMFAIACLSRVL